MPPSPSIPLEDLVSRIRSAVVSSTISTDLERLRNAYDEHVEQVNARLMTAAQWLRKGLVSEASHFVESHPNALDAAGSLELADLAHFLELCNQAGLELPRRVDLDLVKEIEASHEGYHRIQPLIDRHRAVAILRGGARLRLKCVVELIAADRGNPSWGSELKTAVACRIREIGTEGRAAAGRLDVGTLEQLLARLARPPLNAHPQAATTRKELESYRQAVQRRLDEKAVSDVGPALHDAFGAGSIEGVRDALAILKPIRDRGLVHLEESLTSELDAAASMLADRDSHAEIASAHTSDCHRLQELLDQSAPWPEIERVWAQIVRRGLPIPEELSRRTRVRRDEASSERRIKLGAKAAIATLLVAGAAAAIGWFLYARDRAETVAGYVKEISAALDRKDVESAGVLVSSVREAGLQDEPELTSVLAQFDDAMRAADTTDAQFDAERGALESIERFSSADLKRAERLREGARTAAQRSTAEAMVGRIKAELDQRSAAADSGVEQERNRLVAEASQVKDAAKDDEALVGGLTPILRELDELRQTPELSTEAQTALATVRESLSKDLREANERTRRAAQRGTELRDLEQFRGSLTQLVALLDRFIDTYPESPQAARFHEVLKNRESLLATDDTLVKLRALAGELAPSTQESTRALIDSIELIPPTFLPGLDEVDRKDVLGSLETLERLHADPSLSPIAMFRQTFTAAWCRRTLVVTDREGATYFSFDGRLEKIAEQAGEHKRPQYRLTEVVRGNADLLPDARRPTAHIELSFGANPESALMPAPMARLADRVNEAIKKAEQDPHQLPGLPLRIAAHIQEASDVPAPLRAELLEQALKSQHDLGWPDAGVAQRGVDLLGQCLIGGRTPLADCLWDKSTTEGRKAEEEFASILRELGNLTEIADARLNGASRGKLAIRQVVMVGLAWPIGGTGGSQIGATLPLPDGTVFVVHPGPGGQGPRLDPVGTSEAGLPRWTAEPPPIGTPLLMVK